MAEWFSKIKVLWDWYWYYPSPARWLFAITLAMGLVSGLAFLKFHKVAMAAKAKADFAEAVPISVDVDETALATDLDGESKVPEDRVLHYTADQSGGLVIKPVLPYLEKWNRGDEVEALFTEATRFRWRFPTLDVRLTNTTDKPLILNSMVLEVSRSVPNDNPAILVLNDFQSQMSFKIVTPLKDELTQCVVSYQVLDAAASTPATDALPASGPLTTTRVTTAPVSRPSVFTATIPTLSGVNEVRVDDALAAAGVATDELRADVMKYFAPFFRGFPPPELGPFKNGSAKIRGQLSVRRGDKTLGPYRFLAEVSLLVPGPQTLLAPSSTYQFQLREYGTNYDVKVASSNQIAPKGGERILITLGAPRSSSHEFRLRLRFHDGQERVTDPIKLDLLRPD